MKNAAIQIQTDLTADTALQALVDGEQYWELAPDNTKVPYITYRITENQQASKDRRGDYDVELWCFEKRLTDAAELSDLVKDAMDKNPYRFRGAQSGYVDDDTKEGFIKLIYNFKL